MISPKSNSYLNVILSPAKDLPISTIGQVANNEDSSPATRAQNDNKEDSSHIRFGLNGIKNLGEHIAEVIYRERKERGKYKDLEDLLSRVKDKDLNKKSLESLIKCGALDSFGFDRGLLLGNMDNLLSFVREHQETKSTKQNSLFSNSNILLASKVRLAPAPNATAEEKLTWEKELLGLYVSSHPFSYYQKLMERVLTPITELSGLGRKEWVVIGGVIDSAKKKITRAGATMMFVTVQDVSSSIELLVFPKTYETTKNIWVEGKTVCVVGRTSEEEGDDKLFVERAYELNKDNVRSITAQMAQVRPASGTRESASHPTPAAERIDDYFEIRLSPAKMKEKAEAIKTVLRKFPGSKPVLLSVGDKRIKTSFSVDAEGGLKDELQNVLS